MNPRDDQRLQVQQATDIVQLVGEHLALRRKGKEFVGLCPFHDDQSPSMYVSPAKQIYKCFSCGAGGSVFDFVMNYHKMSFIEALKHLAERAGIKLERRDEGRGRDEGPSERERLAIANACALQFFRGCYRHAEHGATARAYVDRRGIHPDMVEAFQLGYAPDRWDGLVQTIASKGWNVTDFLAAGLLKRRDEGRATRDEGAESESSSPSSLIPRPSSCYDALRHRLVFPILDSLGRPIAFGGRKLREEDEPKYLNSPETKLFNKSATLYGLHLAKKPIIDQKVAAIVEGYTDVIACHQAGVSNVVATLGTALTPQHAAELRRYCDKVVLIFDADAAGQKAADRAVEVFLTGDIDVAIAVLPSPTGEKVDPAELLAQEEGLDLWKQAIVTARDALDYQFERVRAELDAQTTLSGRQRVAEGYVQRLAGLGVAKTGILRSAMVRTKVAQMLHLGESDVATLMQRFAPRSRRVTPDVVGPSQAPESVGEDHAEDDLALGVSRAKLSALRIAERDLLAGLVQSNDLFHAALSDGRSLDEAVAAADMVSSEGRRLFEMLHDRLAEGRAVTLPDFLGELAQAEALDLTRWMTDAAMSLKDKAFNDEALQHHLLAMAEALVRHGRESQRKVQRVALIEQVRTSGGDALEAAQRMIEHARAGVSPARIARISA